MGWEFDFNRKTFISRQFDSAAVWTVTTLKQTQSEKGRVTMTRNQEMEVSIQPHSLNTTVKHI